MGALGDQIQPQVSCLELIGRRGQPRDWKTFLKIRLSPEIARGTRAPLKRERGRLKLEEVEIPNGGTLDIESGHPYNWPIEFL